MNVGAKKGSYFGPMIFSSNLIAYMSLVFTRINSTVHSTIVKNNIVIVIVDPIILFICFRYAFARCYDVVLLATSTSNSNSERIAVLLYRCYILHEPVVFELRVVLQYRPVSDARA